MRKYTREPKARDFLEWAKENPKDFEAFYEEHLYLLLLDLEQDDYFGTEGFDKRFA